MGIGARGPKRLGGRAAWPQPPGLIGQGTIRAIQTAASEAPASLRTHSRNAALIGSSAVASGPTR